MVQVRTKSRSQIVRELLHELGFMSNVVPKNWKNRVLVALKNRNVEPVHDTIIYQERLKYLREKKKQDEAKEAKRKQEEAAKLQPKQEEKSKQDALIVPVSSPSPSLVVPTPPTEQSQTPMSLTLNDAQEIKTFAKKYGGISKCIEALQAVQNLLAE
jgi:nitrous oxide reductase